MIASWKLALLSWAVPSRLVASGPCLRQFRRGGKHARLWLRRHRTMILVLLVCLDASSQAHSAPAWRSHPPMRVPPPLSRRPLEKGPTFFVDVARGVDANPGTEQQPWKTIHHALGQLKAGDTLCLRGGTYFESVSVSLVGRPGAPITIRGYPGEQAVIHGGLREFFESPEQAWEPVPGGTEGEFRSVHPYPNIRDVVGAFGDSFVGLQTYWHRFDLAATNELWGSSGTRPSKKDLTKDTRPGEADVDPVYCGPGLWYDHETNRIHVRLAHTHLDWPGVPNYEGETDPRKLPLVIAPFAAVPLHVDGAQHVRFQDLTICGGGYNTVVIDLGLDVEFDNVTVHCGTYGLLATNTIGFRFYNSALYGNIPPWGSRVENGLRARPGRSTRDVARLTGHALLVADGHDEYSVYAYPFNRDWEISHSEFTDTHDGPYLGGVENLRFHHNLLDNCEDDGIYISAMYPYAPQSLFIYQNRIGRCLTALAFGGEHPPTGPVYVYRNIFDLSVPPKASRPTPAEPVPAPVYGVVAGNHGSPQWAPLYFYQNTCILSGYTGRRAWCSLLLSTSKERPRRIFNNVFEYFETLPKFEPAPPADHDLQTNGNLFWLHGSAAAAPKTDFLADFRKSKLFEQTATAHAPGWEAGSFIADPMFLRVDIPNAGRNDYRLRKGSPAIGRGLILPADWPDPLRPARGGNSDIGALPSGAEPLDAGRIRP